MPTIHLTTKINAPIETCFNLSRNIDLHKASMQHIGEQVVGGVTHGLIGLNETVTFKARHFGLPMWRTVKITELIYATSFTVEQVNGFFKKLKHRHIFEFAGANATMMTDEFYFESPMNFIGRWINQLFLKGHITRLLLERNAFIKQAAENTTQL